MIIRELETQVEIALRRQSAVVLLGPRQVGKTTLALNIGEKRKSIYLDLESSEDIQKLQDPLLYLKTHQDCLVILDEIQRFPDLFLSLRGIIDERRRNSNPNGHFLLLGSASLDLMKQSSESLAGRITQLELSPFCELEVQGHGGNNFNDYSNNDYSNELWLKGGFPNSFLESDNSFSFQWRKDFIKTYLERDIPQLSSSRVPSETIRRFWMMLAHLQGGILNASQLASNVGVSVQSISRYIDLLVDLLLVRRIPPYHSNFGKRIVKSPKVYIRDSGLVHTLLGIKDLDVLLGHPIVGASYESYVIENCINCAPLHANAYFYRSLAGAEIDLVLEMPDKSIWAIEIKRSLSPKLQKGFYFAKEDLKPKKSFVIYAGKERYPIASDIEAISLHDFLLELKKFN